ncbi:MAG: hypothetical protein ACYC6Q_10685 [Syntrophales bacterium]
MGKVSRLNIAPVFLFALMLCAGCASMAERGLLPDVKARPLPDVFPDPEIILLEKAEISGDSLFKSLVSADGRAHLFLSDKKKKIHHLEISNRVVLQHEILGALEVAPAALDAVEHPEGKLRVIAGDRQFIQSAPGNGWEEVRGNLCTRFVKAGDNLLCAFIANGRELGSPMRRDWTVGWFILLPVVFWSDVFADKLVLAQESSNGWIIRAVFDPETKLSARQDFMAGGDAEGFLHFLYRSSGGSTAFIVAFAPGGGVVSGADVSAVEIRYARFHHEQLTRAEKMDVAEETGKENGSSPWKSIPGIPLNPMPYIVDKYQRPDSLKMIGPLDRRFAVNSVSGDPCGLVRAWSGKLDDGAHKIGSEDTPWIHVHLRDGQWGPRFEIVTAGDLPESGWRWYNDRYALISNDSRGNNHALLVKSKAGFWKSTNELCYFYNTGNNWSAPLVLGDSLGVDSPRSLSAGQDGKVFAAWLAGGDRIVGRWIIPKK